MWRHVAWNIKILKKTNYLSHPGLFLLIVCETENRPCHCHKKYRSADFLSKSTVASCQIRDFTVSPSLAIAQIPKQEIIVFVFVWSVSPSFPPPEEKQNGFPFSIHRFPTISAGKKVSIPPPLPSSPFPPSCSVVLTAAAEDHGWFSLSLSSCGVCYLSLFSWRKKRGKNGIIHTHTHPQWFPSRRSGDTVAKTRDFPHTWKIRIVILCAIVGTSAENNLVFVACLLRILLQNVLQQQRGRQNCGQNVGAVPTGAVR